MGRGGEGAEGRFKNIFVGFYFILFFFALFITNEQAKRLS